MHTGVIVKLYSCTKNIPRLTYSKLILIWFPKQLRGRQPAGWLRLHVQIIHERVSS
ncbi:hypothetical protein SCLCIDRAFT_483110 [Scleroderma citrinum Foug A]|uniref:Uncharacterized protein n=1 Tax=Scleroderma citrinum Foug A TaxID=1036808 RepID=A0A0C2ZJH4_9AGAM|nr:hypothetical protein SCLCIDRAFT_483110 [Scleroderma citrinum Foug A]